MTRLDNRLKKTRVKQPPHLIVGARAGTGKTTTNIEGIKYLKGLPVSITPSPQQRAIWDSIAKSRDSAHTICCVAFNKPIAVELQKRVPPGCDAMTMHSMGFREIRGTFSNIQVNQYRVQEIIAELLGKDIRDLRRNNLDFIRATERLVGLCKMNLTLGPYTEKQVQKDDGYKADFQIELADLVSHYDVDLNGHQREVFDLVPRVLERCKDVATDGCIDFNDMIWLPVVLDLNIFRYDLLLVDEAQDLNRCIQALALRAGRRLILCGDDRQAIYGWAGADSNSIPRMMKQLSLTDQGCEYLPLTVTRRCGKAIVREAQKIVPDFEAHPSRGEGRVSYAQMKDALLPTRGIEGAQFGYMTMVEDGDMILCRCNAPLVSECFKFLRAGRKANIQGWDVGQGLINTIQKLMKHFIHDRIGESNSDVLALVNRLSDWLHAETRKENAKRNPSESRLIALQDKHDCILCFTEDQTTVEGVVLRIESIFTDDKDGSGIKLSSVHKAKGLEANRVFILLPEGAEMPHKMAKSKWQVDQEWNLKYVAITRAIEELIYVS